VLITFSGLDGAGKSTLIDWLRARLEARGYPVVVFHMNDHIGLYAYLRKARNAVLHAPAPTQSAEPTGAAAGTGGPGGRLKPVLRRVRYAVVWNKPLRRWIYLLDLVVFQCYRLVVEHLRGQVLIMDRYFYDTLVDVSDGRRWRWVRLLERMTPTPAVPVFLDIGPEESYRRKGEYSVEYLRRRYLAYRQVFAWVPSAVQVVNDDLDATRVALWRSVAERVPYCRASAVGLEAFPDDRHP
jgi:thymidylate kinase